MSKRAAVRLLFVAFASVIWCTVAAAQVLVRVSKNEIITQAGWYAGEVWYTTDTAVYRVVNNKPELVLEEPAAVVAEVREGEIWIGTLKGLFRWNQDGVMSHLQDAFGQRRVTAIRTVGDATWIGVDREGLFRAEIDKPVLEVGRVVSIESLGGRLWVNTENNVYTEKADGSWKPLFDEKEISIVGGIVEAKDTIWVTTQVYQNQFGPCYRVVDGKPEKLDKTGVAAVAAVGNEVWFATTEGLFKLAADGSGLVRLAEFPSEPVNAIAELDGERWLATPRGAYRYSPQAGYLLFPDGHPRPENQVSKVGIAGLFKAAGYVWAWGQTGLYRFEEDVTIDLRMSIVSVLGLDFVLGEAVRIDDVYYIDGQGRRDPFGQYFDGGFRAIVRTSANDLDEALKNEDDLFTHANSYLQNLDYGRHELHVAVRDASGNIRKKVLGPVFALPITVILSVFFSLVGTGLLAMTLVWGLAGWGFLFAPQFLSAMSMVNNRFEKGSFGLLPFLLVWPGLRHYLLLRYRRYLKQELPPPTCARSTITVQALGALSKSRRLRVLGHDRVARRAFLCSLTQAFAQGELGDERLRRAVPIYLDLEAYLGGVQTDPRKTDIVNGILGQLANFGDVNDPQLGRALLDHGDFIFLLDAFDHVSAQGRLVVQQLIDQYERENYFVIGTSHDAPVSQASDFPDSLDLSARYSDQDLRSDGEGSSRDAQADEHLPVGEREGPLPAVGNGGGDPG